LSFIASKPRHAHRKKNNFFLQIGQDGKTVKVVAGSNECVGTSTVGIGLGTTKRLFSLTVMLVYTSSKITTIHLLSQATLIKTCADLSWADVLLDFTKTTKVCTAFRGEVGAVFALNGGASMTVDQVSDHFLYNFFFRFGKRKSCR